jgi:CheY-like chemotaxis protein
MVINLKTVAPKSILVVDDEPVVADTIRLLLMINRHRVEVAEDGEKALALHEKGKYDLVIVDLALPGMDGLELARRIRVRNPQQPIIMITAHKETVTNDKRKANIDAILGKPFSPQQLQEVLVEVFPGG